jgi:hypothetical protein
MRIIFYKIRHVKYVNCMFVQVQVLSKVPQYNLTLPVHMLAQTTVLEFHCTCTRSLIMLTLRADH